MTPPYFTFCFISTWPHLFEFGLQLCDLLILTLDLVLFHGQHTLHVLILVLERDNVFTPVLIVVYKFAKCLISIFCVLLMLTFDQSWLLGVVGDSLLNELFPGVKRPDLTCLSMQKSVVKVNQSFVLHLAVTATASSIVSFILKAEFDFMLRAVITYWDSTLSTVVMLLAAEFELFEFSEGNLA